NRLPGGRVDARRVLGIDAVRSRAVLERGGTAVVYVDCHRVAAVHLVAARLRDLETGRQAHERCGVESARLKSAVQLRRAEAVECRRVGLEVIQGITAWFGDIDVRRHGTGRNGADGLRTANRGVRFADRATKEIKYVGVVGLVADGDVLGAHSPAGVPTTTEGRAVVVHRDEGRVHEGLPAIAGYLLVHLHVAR